jgi:hypothetical protein
MAQLTTGSAYIRLGGERSATGTAAPSAISLAARPTATGKLGEPALCEALAPEAVPA